jgi:hypothetical protein
MQTSLRSVALLVVLFIAGGAATRVHAADNPAEGTALNVPFPEVKGWALSPQRPLPPESGGYTVAYNSEERVAVTIYVYNHGHKSIPNDLSAAVVQKEMAGAKDALQQARQMGIYKEVKEEASGESTLGAQKDGPKMLYARFRIQIRDQETVSEIYVLPYQNHFVKLRITRPVNAPAAVAILLDRLYGELNKVLAK